MRASSFVLIPGSITCSRASSVSTTTRQALRMRSSSDQDLRMLTRLPPIRVASPSSPNATLAGAAEAVVVAHHELRLDLRHRVHGHAHHDQEGRAAEEEVEVQALGDPPETVVGQ